ncbi:hypothetical protein F5Y18DRAFT_420589 [Xylariaceae sp. FL1019]|nr:hypothetical protein F5Y18DRAFT_420589 [Xylariaceae sp. FL1019]
MSYPQPKRRAPIVGPATGSLVVVGGGTLDDKIYAEVVTRAKGGPIIVIPTADGEQETYPQDFAPAPTFRRLGASSVTVLHTYDPAVADTDAFVAPLLNATGVWFVGGRQWRLVDAYAGTKAETAFRGVLDRGGVIAGSSAGASIQASFLARGDTENNQVMVGDHTVGFGYLRGVAVDQHVLVRGRQFDMFDILKEYPELLGLGCDENTALVVEGDRATILGHSYCGVWDGKFWAREGSEMKTIPPVDQRFYFLREGDVYDMAAREVVVVS